MAFKVLPLSNILQLSADGILVSFLLLDSSTIPEYLPPATRPCWNLQRHQTADTLPSFFRMDLEARRTRTRTYAVR